MFQGGISEDSGRLERGAVLNFAFSEEQEEFRRSLRRFMEDKSPIAEVRRLMETESGFDREVWDQMASQLGLCGLGVPEKFGGLGFGYVELGIAFEEMGRALLCAPYFSTVALGVNLLLASRDDSICDEILPSVISGEVRLAFGASESESGWSLDEVSSEATGGASPILKGTKPYVIDGASATHFLVLARSPEGLSLYLVDGMESGIVRQSLTTLDLTRKIARVELDRVPARLVGVSGQGRSYYDRMLPGVLTLLAAEQVGGAQRVLEMAVEYAKTRIQFGRPIGSFQAIKHKCADMLVDVESAKSASYYATWAMDGAPDEIPLVAYLAKAFCSEAYFSAAAENIQIHGGIGFTWEHDAHLYFKRAKASELLFGTPEFYREQLALSMDL